MTDYFRYLQQQKELYGDVLYLESDSHSKSKERSKGRKETEGCLQTILASSDEDWRQTKSLNGLYNMICGCLKCPLGHSRKNFVFGVGNPNADIVLIGEAPGADEDAQGEPFVGRAGQLLNKIIEAINLKREEVYICNILKCRPPNNRDPLSSEVGQCEPYLHQQLKLIKPKIMLALGRIAAQTLLRSSESLTVLRSKVHTYQGIPLMVTYHPAALLRNPNWKRPTWGDIQRFRALYDEIILSS